MANGTTNPWQPHEDAAFRRMWADGTPTRAMAKALGRGLGGVVQRRKTLRLPPRAAIGRGRGGKQTPHPERCTPNNRKAGWTEAEDAELARLVQLGYSARQAGKALGKSRAAVNCRANRLGFNFACKLNGRPKRNAMDNNPAGLTVTRLRAGKRLGPDPVPAERPVAAPIAIGELGFAQCRYIGERPAVLTVDTPIYCGARTDGGSWCPEHRALVFQPRKPATVTGPARPR